MAAPEEVLASSFIGEPGVDSGALRKDFLTEMMSGIETRFFEGGESGKNPKYSMVDIDKHSFRTVGEMFASRREAHHRIVYTVVLQMYGEWRKEIKEQDVTDSELEELIKEIKAADETTLMTYTDRILSLGPTSNQREDDVLWLLPTLQLTCSGLKPDGLLSVVQEEHHICQQLLVPGSLSKVDADFMVRTGQ